MKFKTKLAYTSIVLAALAACGGGGGGSTDSTVTPTPTPVTNGGNLATSVPTPTYASGSTQLAIFNQINDVRLKGGFGMLAQDVVLDKAASNHASYLISNFYNDIVPSGIWWNPGVNSVDPSTGWLMGHVENSGNLGFTGVLPVNRVAAAGSQFSYVGEVVSFRGFTQLPTDCAGELLNTIFHRNGLLNSQLSSIGIAYVTTPDSKSGACVINPAMKSVATVRPTGWIGVYPGEHQTSVPTGMPIGEAPDPAPGVPNAQKGSPVSIYLNSSLSSVSSFTLIATGTTESVPVVQITYSNFPTYLTKNEAHILPTRPLNSKTTYTANFVGVLSDGTNVKKSWSFVTQ
jgi:uncharacterized protein YkwD